MQEEQKEVAVTPPAPKQFSNKEKKDAIESAIYWFSTQNPFYAAFLQEVNISYSEQCPSAAICYDKKRNEYKVELNPSFFCALTVEQRIAILQHEVLHFTHGHLMIFMDITADPKEHKKLNFAGDIAINQYIANLPEGVLDVKMFKDKLGMPFPLYKTMQTYYELLKEASEKKNKDGSNGDPNKELMDKYGTLDEHNWEELTEEEKHKMLTEAKKLIQRTLDKTSREFGDLDQGLKDLLEKIEMDLEGMNYKHILKQVIKKTMSSNDRDSSWKKKNKRYGWYSPGLTNGQSPSMTIYIDTSGSISHKEVSAFLQVVEGFLKAGSKKCKLGLWHTDMYYLAKFKMNDDTEKLPWESGGTDISAPLNSIMKEKPDLAIILTDGCYSACDIKPNTEVLFVISEESAMKHPMCHIGKTISLKGVTGR